MSLELKVEPHRESWKTDFESEALLVADAFGSAVRSLHHIASTAIPGIWAKPIIDMMAEADGLEAIDARRARMEELGYEVMGEFGIQGRRYFRRTSPAGVRTHHIHIFLTGSSHAIRHLAFRDYLRSPAHTAI